MPNIPLITASIMSKKLAEGAETLVFDVKCGRAAFMQTPDSARLLAQSLIRVGRTLNRKTGALITDMDQPLGRTAGNAVEVIEAIETLKGGGPSDTRHLTIGLTAQMTVLGGIHSNAETARSELARRLDDGRALEVFRQMVTAHGGDERIIDGAERFPKPGIVIAVPAPTSGTVSFVDAQRIGRIVLQLGAGRKTTADVIDPAAGIDQLVQAGEEVEAGQPLMRLRAKDASLTEPLVAAAAAAVRIMQGPVPARLLVLEQVETEIDENTAR